jgi:capsular exopolysaccharide synthesis family protein
MHSIKITTKNSDSPILPSSAWPIAGKPFTYTQTQIQAVRDAHLQANRIIAGFKSGKWVESYKMLRTRCLQAMDANHWNTLAITSPSGNSGNSLTAANLAVSIALELNRSALLVDSNLQHPSLCKLFGIQGETGLGDYLLNDIPLNEVLINPGIDRLVVLPAGKVGLNSSELLRSPKMLQLVSELKLRYPSRIVIFDLPPLLSQADALGFLPFIDCVLLVLDEGHTKTEELKQAASLLQEMNVLGTVLNKASDCKIKYLIK